MSSNNILKNAWDEIMNPQTSTNNQNDRFGTRKTYKISDNDLHKFINNLNFSCQSVSMINNNTKINYDSYFQDDTHFLYKQEKNYSGFGNVISLSSNKKEITFCSPRSVRMARIQDVFYYNTDFGTKHYTGPIITAMPLFIMILYQTFNYEMFYLILKI